MKISQIGEIVWKWNRSIEVLAKSHRSLGQVMEMTCFSISIVTPGIPRYHRPTAHASATVFIHPTLSLLLLIWGLADSPRSLKSITSDHFLLVDNLRDMLNVTCMHLALLTKYHLGQINVKNMRWLPQPHIFALFFYAFIFEQSSLLIIPHNLRLGVL